MTDANGLDPRPFREMMTTDNRVASLEVAPDHRAYLFDPRPQYSQDREDYAA